MSRASRCDGEKGRTYGCKAISLPRQSCCWVMVPFVVRLCLGKSQPSGARLGACLCASLSKHRPSTPSLSASRQDRKAAPAARPSQRAVDRQQKQPRHIYSYNGTSPT